METNYAGEAMLYIIGEGSNHYLGESYLPSDEIERRMEARQAISIRNVRQVVTFNIPTPKGINRLTRLVTVDVALGPLPVMVVVPTSMYPVDLTPALKELIQSAEEDEIKSRAGRAGLTSV